MAPALWNFSRSRLSIALLRSMFLDKSGRICIWAQLKLMVQSWNALLHGVKVYPADDIPGVSGILRLRTQGLVNLVHFNSFYWGVVKVLKILKTVTLSFSQLQGSGEGVPKQQAPLEMAVCVCTFLTADGSAAAAGSNLKKKVDAVFIPMQYLFVN